MPQTSGVPLGTSQTVSRPSRVPRSLGLRLRRGAFLPGDSLADAVKRTAVLVTAWGTLIGVLAWGASALGVLHSVGEGIAFCGILFALAVLKAPDFTNTDGSGHRPR